MPLDNKPTNDSPDSSAPGKANNFSNQFAMAMELPFVLVGAVLLGGVLGYFLDRWLHPTPAHVGFWRARIFRWGAGHNSSHARKSPLKRQWRILQKPSLPQRKLSGALRG